MTVFYAFSFLVSRFSFLVSRFSFLVSRFSFLVSRFVCCDRILFIGFVCGIISLVLQNLSGFLFPDPLRPDETFQYLEPAHFLVDGHAALTWEWRENIRSWLVPGSVAGLMKVAYGIGFSTPVYFVHFIISILFLPVIFLFVLYGKRLGGKAWAWCFGLTATFWPDYVMLVYRTLGETIGAVFILAGVILGSLILLKKNNHIDSAHSSIVWLFCGLSFGIASAVRFQFLPIVGLTFLFLFFLERDWRGVIYGSAAFLSPLLVLGGVDWVTFHVPYYSIFHNYYVNQTLHRADTYGVEKFFYYWNTSLLFFKVTTVCFVILVVGGFLSEKRKLLIFPFFLFIGMITFHSFIPHKEYSFILPSLFLMPFMALISLFGLHQTFSHKRLENNCYRKVLLYFLISTIPFLMVTRCVELYRSNSRNQFYSGAPWNRGTFGLNLEATSFKDLCGLVAIEPSVSWAWLAGYTWMPRNTGLFVAHNAKELAPLYDKFNYLIAGSGITEDPQFGESLLRAESIKCSKENVCLYKLKNHTCSVSPDYGQFSEILKKYGQ